MIFSTRQSPLTGQPQTFAIFANFVRGLPLRWCFICAARLVKLLCKNNFSGAAAMDEKLMEILAKVLEERGLHQDAADFRDGDKAPVAMEAMRRAYALGQASAAPGHTDMMVTPESIDKFLAENSLPEQS